MTDREQTRRDAELALAQPKYGLATRLADECLTLLDELEQAEQARDEWKAFAESKQT